MSNGPATTDQAPIQIDAAIIGGGIAGTWLYHLLHKRGYSVVLLEGTALGTDQTLASQGMIHGGLKYALSGVTTRASEAIASMPARWRACLAQQDDIDLSALQVVADRYYMFANNSALGKLTSFFASRALRGRIEKVRDIQALPQFKGFDGVVYALNDFVIDTRALLAHLVSIKPEHALSLQVDETNLSQLENGEYRIQLQDLQLQCGTLISCAGNGSGALLRQLRVANIEVQQRPLNQIIVRPRHQVELYAHCLTGVTTGEPRLTITSHHSDTADGSQGRLLWYVGGLLASDGVHLSDAEQIAKAARELQTCVPWLDWQGAEYEVLRVNRAEPRQAAGRRPDEAYAAREGNFIQCFPTKLTLAPDLGDRVLKLLPPPRHPGRFHSNHPRAAVGSPPW